MEMPSEYVDREHTWLKHRVLQLYLEAWAHKLGSIGRKRTVRLWYVDCFAGPWRAQNEELRDTSIHIGLDALQSAATTWAKQGTTIALGAIFVERDNDAFAELKRFLGERSGQIEVHPLHGAFGDQVGTIQHLVGSESAFLFVDPTGWKGAAMKFIAPLVRQPRRDLLVNVMFNDMNRFKDDPREFIRSQMRDFFALADSDIPAGLSEDELVSLYRERLKEVCCLEFAADLSVPHPTHERTKFRLVVGGHHPEVIRLFREVEKRAVGAEASAIRMQAKERQRLARTKQQPLFAPPPPLQDTVYARLRHAGLEDAEAFVGELLRQTGAIRYASLWPRVLENCHISEADLKDKLLELRQQGAISIPSLALGTSLKADHVIQLVQRR